MAKTNIKPNERERKWYIVDAAEYNIGRLASQIAFVLQGKHTPQYTPQWDMGDYVVVINAQKIKASGTKEENKNYYRHTGYPGGIRSRSLREMRAEKPTEIIEIAVRGMLPKSKLAGEMIKKLKVYAGNEHPHEAQQPLPLEVK